ncbi:MAG: hypothetical protein K6G27_08260 [Lachnospiraceae bacterium]|nr:hypothetical protein [Lachnospiraceae bacterium]
MKKRIYRIITVLVILLSISFRIFGTDIITSQAAQSTTRITNSYYDYGSDGEYAVTGVSSNGSTTGTLGTFSITGNTESIGNVNGYTAFEVKSDVVSFDYSIGTKYISDDDYIWHIVNDKTKDFDGGKLESNVGNGTVLVQTSLTGEKWITEAVYYDVLGDKTTYYSDIYTSKVLQQVNGCFFRVIILYKLEKRIENNNYGPISVSNYDEKRCAEIYKFYLIDSGENQADATQPDSEPRMELGETINTGKDNGYSGNVPIDDKDPHREWNIGRFYVNGYTRSTIDSNDNTIVFVKTLGDRVTLWFNLEQDIYALNGNSDLYINEDNNAYDQYFRTGNLNFKHGTLIIRYTDYQGVRHDPVIYTDYLAACATTGADTKVELFEEGDYEIALDYEVVEDKAIDTYNDYRIFFKFKIRNGNCMAFPFDISTGNELSDGSITSNGFKLDLAKSRYLTIDVIRYSLKLVDGVYVQDARSNSPAKDGESYTQQGVYQFTVRNLYTNTEDTSKIIYVGTDPIYKALSRGIYTLDEINTMLSEGGVLESDGTITMPITEVPDESIDDGDTERLPENDVPDQVISDSEPASDSSTVSVNPTVTPEEIVDVVPERNGSNNYVIIVVIALIGIVACVGILAYRKEIFKSKDKEQVSYSDQTSNTETKMNDSSDKEKK